jgi:hypothetical protein
VYPRGCPNPPDADPAKKGDTAMDQETTTQSSSSSQMWERAEEFVREQVQGFTQALLEEEVSALLGRPKSARRAPVDGPQGMRNGYGPPRRLSLTAGTIPGRRPRVRGLSPRFVRCVLPLFTRRTRAVGDLLPRLYGHGLCGGISTARSWGSGAMLRRDQRPPGCAARRRGSWSMRPGSSAGWTTWKSCMSGPMASMCRPDWKRPKPPCGWSPAPAPPGKTLGSPWRADRGHRRHRGARYSGNSARGLKPWRCTIADGHLGIGAGRRRAPVLEPSAYQHARCHAQKTPG